MRSYVTQLRALRIILAVGVMITAGSVSAEPIRDARGKVIALWPAPRRVVSATLMTDEILVDLLGVEKIGERVVALSPLVDDPRFSNVVDRARAVSKRFGEEVESLLKLRPDMVLLATYNRPELVSALERARVRTFVMPDVKNLDDIPSAIATVGRVLGVEPEAQRLIEGFRIERRAVRDRLRVGIPWAPFVPPRVMNFDADGVIYGSGTMYDSIVREAGGENLPASMAIAGWSKVSDEALAAMRPDWVVVLDDGTPAVRQMARMRDTAAWRQIPAVREGRVIFVPEREMSSVSHQSLKAVERLGNAFMTLREGAVKP